MMPNNIVNATVFGTMAPLFALLIEVYQGKTINKKLIIGLLIVLFGSIIMFIYDFSFDSNNTNDNNNNNTTPSKDFLLPHERGFTPAVSDSIKKLPTFASNCPVPSKIMASSRSFISAK